MNYMLMRNGQQYGPYTLADLQRYVAAGNILVSDLVKSEGMDNWVPLSQIIGNIPVPAPAAPQWTPPPMSPYPPPPSLHWGIVLALADRDLRLVRMGLGHRAGGVDKKG